MFSNQKNKWNLGVKSNFENLKFWVVPISKYALVMTTVVASIGWLALKNRLHPKLKIFKIRFDT